ncbi:MAG: hypothetical protein WDZ69_00915 [Candidatus Pacearchaeota archaeon]
MYTLPQEIETWYIIPAIRREISISLSKDYGVSYQNIGVLLGISKAAVSQYLRKKRASKIKLHPKAMDQVKKSADKLFHGKSDSLREITKILNLIKKKKLHCEICGKMINGVLHDCKEIKVPVIDLSKSS